MQINAKVNGPSASELTWSELEQRTCNEVSSVRRNAALEIGRLSRKLGKDHIGAIAVLCRLCFDDDSPMVRYAALSSLACYNWPQDCVTRLQSIIEDVSLDLEHREIAARMLGVAIPGGVYRKELESDVEVKSQRAIEVSKSIIGQRSKRDQDIIHNSLNRGKAVLSSEDQCAGYMAWFAKKHLAKFRKAFEYLPKECFDNTIDLFDWGCGIGLASFEFRDWYDANFPERRYAKKIRRITLIEPSNIALEWASYNTTRCFPEAKVVAVPKRFRDLEMKDFGDTGNPTQSRVHVLSNVLDIKDVTGGAALDDLVATIRSHVLGWDDVFVLISPDYGKVERTFALFMEKLCVDLAVEVEGLLKPTHFEWSKSEDGVGAKGVIGVWRVSNSEKRNGLALLSPKWRAIYDMVLLDERADGRIRSLVDAVHADMKELHDREIGIRYRPNLYGEQPDLVLLQKNKLPLIISLGADSSNDIQESRPSKQFLSSANGVVNALLKHNRTLFQIDDAFRLLPVCAYDSQGNRFAVYDRTDYGDNGKKDVLYKWQTWLPWKDRKSNVGSNVYNVMIDLLKGKDVNQSIKSITWDAKQLRLIKSTPGLAKVSGCFGSGKTTVLVERAINAYKRTHKTVLILTFNISLRNHIENAIAERVDFKLTGNEFLVLNFHQFIKSYGLSRLQISATRNIVEFLNNGQDALAEILKESKNLQKFRTILVDECQDYQYEWLEMLLRAYLANGGEYVLFGDEKQNVYGRALDGKKFRTNVPGGWNQLNKCHRSEGDLLDFVLSFQSLMPKYDHDIVERVLLLDDSTVAINNFEINDYNAYAVFIEDRIAKLGLELGEVAVLAETRDFLRAVESAFRNRMKCQSEVMFWKSEELVDKKSRKNHDERYLKLFFDGDQTERIKFSTIESFKGFESSCVFVFIESDIGGREERLLERVYTGISRARKHLFVCNVGNKEMGNLLCKIKNY